MFKIRSKELEGTNPQKVCAYVCMCLCVHVHECTHVLQSMKRMLQADETLFGQKDLREGRILSKEWKEDKYSQEKLTFNNIC